jgi:hypothetical protein
MTAARLLAAVLLALGARQGVAAGALREFDSGSMAAIEAAHRGKPFVMMVWSLDCVYCPASLAQLAKARQLEVVTVATDRADQDGKRALIARKLGARLARANAWAFGAAPPEQLRYAIDPAWRGETPRTYWYDAKGGRTARSGPVTAERIADFLRRQPSQPTSLSP